MRRLRVVDEACGSHKDLSWDANAKALSTQPCCVGNYRPVRQPKLAIPVLDWRSARVGLETFSLFRSGVSSNLSSGLTKNWAAPYL